MQPHPHTHRLSFRPDRLTEHPLPSNSARDPVLRTLEHGEQLIRSAVDLVTTRFGHGVPKESTAVTQHRPITVFELVHERRRPLDVREQHRHRPGRKISHVPADTGLGII
jgi:hypothetical protein